ncbi:surface-associated interspersed protein 8.3 (SURFIN 8.3), partial [Plasmodium reichenowi]
MAVKISTPVYKKRISSTAYPLYFSVFIKRLKNYVSQKIKEIKNLGDYEKSCRDLNYEIDELKELFCTRYLLNIPRYVRLASWNKNIEDHLKTTMVSDSDEKCKRSYPFYRGIQRYRRKLLADYCEERDKRKRDVLNSSNDKDKCLEYNEWVIMSDNAINASFNNKITEGDRNNGAYTISNNCSLRKPHLLFPLLECHKEKEPENQLNLFFDSPIYGNSEITNTADGFRNIFNMHIEPKDVAIPFDTSPPVSIPASKITLGSNTPV